MLPTFTYFCVLYKSKSYTALSGIPQCVLHKKNSHPGQYPNGSFNVASLFTEQLGVGTATISVFGTRFLPIATSVFVERSAVFSIRCIEKYDTRFLEIKHNFENEWGQIRNSFVERHMKKEHGVLKKSCY